MPGQAYPDGCYGGTVPRWLAFLTAIPVAYLVWRLGIANLRALSGPAPGTLDEEKPPPEPEDVDDLVRQIRGMGKGTQYYVPRTK